MAENLDIVGVKYVADQKEYAAEMQQLINENARLKAAAEAVGKTVETTAKESAAAISSVKQATSELTKSREEQAKKISRLLHEEKQDLRELKDMMKQAANPQDAKAYEARIRQTENRIKSLTDRSKEHALSLKEIRKATLAAFNTAPIEKMEKQARTFTAELRKMKNDLAKMEEGSAGFTKLSIQAAKLEDKLGDIRTRVKILASDTFAFDALAGAAQGVASGFQLAEGAAALFGSESEDVQKALLNVNAAMAVSQGLQEVSQLLMEENAVKTAVMTGAQKAYNLVVGQSTGAMKNFRIALAATGIGLAVVAIAALAENWDKIKTALGIVNPTTSLFAEETRKAAEASSEAVKDFEIEERWLRALGTAELDVIRIKREKIKMARLDALDSVRAQEVVVKGLERELEIYKKNDVYGSSNYKDAIIEKENQVRVARELLDERQNLFKENDSMFRESITLEKELLKKQNEEKLKTQEEYQQTALKKEQDFQQLVVDNMKDGVQKQLAQEGLNYQKRKEELKGNYAALEELEKQHQLNIKKIIEENQPLQIEPIRSGVKKVTAIKEEGEKTIQGMLAQTQKSIEKKRENDKLHEEEDQKRAQKKAEDRVMLEQATLSSIQSIGTLLIQDEQKRANFQKALAIFELGINTTKAISAGIAASAGVPFPGNLVAIATTVATVLANLAAAKSVLSQSTPPGYKEGVIDLQGPGTGTSDSITARLSRGESVMTASETTRYKDELLAIRGGNYTDLITTKYVLPEIKKIQEAKSTAERMAAGLALQFDDSEIVGNLRKIKPATAKDLNREITRLERSLKRAGKDKWAF